MIRAIVWKELREQGLIAVALAVLGAALLIAAAIFADPPVPSAPASDVLASLGAGRMLTLMLVVTAGMVCGGALFAAEKEAGTMAYLEALPAASWALWRAKLAAGLVLAVVEVGILLGAAAALQLADGPFIVRLIMYALLAFAWGTLGSTLARTTLGSVGIAIPAATVATFVFLLPIALASGTSSGMPRPLGWLLYEALMLMTPLALSAWRFTALDRRRTAEIAESAPQGAREVPKRTRSGSWGIRAMIWLTLRQLRVTGLVLSAFAVAFGLALLLPEMRAVFVWPPLALAAGVLAGLTAFADEQSHRTAIYWGEFRLPIGRAWCVKVSVHLALLAWLLFLMTLPCIIRAQVEPGARHAHGQTTLAMLFHSRLFDELGPQGWKYLLVPAVYGFAFGHLCGLLFRKLVVACGVAMMLGGVGAAALGPSLVAGGVRHWQAWLPAALVLLTGRVLMRPWASDRANGPTSLWRAGVGLGVTVIALGVSLGYRVVQVPLTPDSTADVDFVGSLPNYDENVGGREFRMAAERFARALVATPGPERVAGQRRGPRVEEQLELAVRTGWPKDNEAAELGAYLDFLYSVPQANAEDKPWQDLAIAATDRPVGVYDPPQLVNTHATTALALDNARKMATAILARSLQQQAQGNPDHFVPAFRTVMILSRTVRHGGGLLALEVAQELERLAHQAADRWLERLPLGHSDQSRALALAMRECDTSEVFDLRPHLLADRFVVRGMMQAPAQWLTPALNNHNDQMTQGAAEADLVAVAWAVPWERERTRRLVALAFETLRPDAAGYLVGRPGGPMLQGRARVGEDLAGREAFLRVVRRSVILKAAVRAYLSDQGKPPPGLPDLVSGGYLPCLPEDPYAEGKPFGYRVSAGEELIAAPRGIPPARMPEPPKMSVNPGQVIIWSVGVNRTDEGGKVPPGGPRAEDLVFVVPEPALPK